MIKYIFLLLIFLFISCSSVSDSGSATDVGNAKISGVIVSENGESDSNSTVRLIPITYDAFSDDSSLVSVTTTRATGYYEFLNVPVGEYNIEAAHTVSQTKLINKGVNITKDTELTLPTDTLQPTGTIILSVPELTLTYSNYAYIPGTSIAVVVDSQAIESNRITISRVPVALFESVILKDSSDSLYSKEIGDSLIVTSGDTITNELEAWGYNKEISLNPSDAGINLNSSLHKFPLAIRLHAGNFSFNEAQSAGEDLRFTNSNGKLLPYEIEHWDATNQSALIWVTVDSIKSSTTEKIVIHWGNSSASNLSNSKSVFDTTLGYCGVWHFNSSAVDATANGNNGTVNNCTFPIGQLGGGLSFDGAGSYVEVADSEDHEFVSESFSISLWIKVAEDNGDLDKIVLKEPYGIKSLYGSVEAMVRNGQTFISAKFGKESDFLNKWTLLTCTIDKSSNLMKTYTNGDLIDSVDITAVDDFSSTYNLFMGVDGEEFEGDIDEVRIYKGALSEDYIKLTYASQKENASLITP